MAGIYTRAEAVDEEIALVALVISVRAIMPTRDASFNTIINSFPTGGMSRLMDWGMIINLIVWI